MAWMGQKTDAEPFAAPAAPAAPAAQPVTRNEAGMSNVASIGRSIHIKGELSGNEDLRVAGTVEGKITFAGHSVTIQEHGTVVAEIQAKSVVVCGQVRGDVTATGSVDVTASGTMLGNVKAPRVAIADGAKFKGNVDMDGKS